tara:strand:+ start:668 stop:826 length:159 start_codon:yes stop_codon:yes gene_type:complete
MKDMREMAAKNAMKLSESDRKKMKTVIAQLKKAVEAHRAQHEALQAILDNSK